jgi:hypothetical protein
MPFLIPVTAFAIVAIIVFSLSRVLIAFNKETTPPVALGIAMVILLVCAFLSSRTEHA